MMFSKCNRSIDELRAEAAEKFKEAFGQEIPPDSMHHSRFVKLYSNSCGPFRGGLAMQAMWKFEMDAFIIVASSDEQPTEYFECAAVFAAGRFWAIVKWTQVTTMEEIPVAPPVDQEMSEMSPAGLSEVPKIV